MYIFELLYRFLNKKYIKKNNFNPLDEINSSDEEKCEHIFLPVDSTGEILACTKCGYIIDKKLTDK